MTIPTLIDLLAVTPVVALPPSRLQQEIEFLAAQEVRRAFREVEKAVPTAKPDSVVRCSRVAIAAEPPDGDVWLVHVVVSREPAKA